MPGARRACKGTSGRSRRAACCIHGARAERAAVLAPAACAQMMILTRRVSGCNDDRDGGEEPARERRAARRSAKRRHRQLLISLTLGRRGLKVPLFTAGFGENSHDETRWRGRSRPPPGCRTTSRRRSGRTPRLRFGRSSIISTANAPTPERSPSIISPVQFVEHVHVVLSGDGGDEFFCGYETYAATYGRSARAVRSRRLAGRIGRVAYASVNAATRSGCLQRRSRPVCARRLAKSGTAASVLAAAGSPLSRREDLRPRDGRPCVGRPVRGIRRVLLGAA